MKSQGNLAVSHGILAETSKISDRLRALSELGGANQRQNRGELVSAELKSESSRE